MPNDLPKRTSFTRYRRVSDILQADNALKRKLSKNMAAVCRPDQTHVDFPIEVVYVTDEIHKQGLDAFTLPKLEIIRTAHKLLVENPGPIPMPAPLPPPEAKPKKEAKPKAKEKPKAKPKAKRAPAPKAPATAAPSPAAVEPKTAGEAKGDGVAKLPCPAYVRPGIPYAVGVAAMSNFEAGILLLESTGDAAYRPIIQKAQEVIDETRLHTILPSAQKESSTTG
jgi:hypothetical protein